MQIPGRIQSENPHQQPGKREPKIRQRSLASGVPRSLFLPFRSRRSELRDSLRPHKQSRIPKGSGMSPEVLLAQSSSSSISTGSSIPSQGGITTGASHGWWQLQESRQSRRWTLHSSSPCPPPAQTGASCIPPHPSSGIPGFPPDPSPTLAECTADSGGYTMKWRRVKPNPPWGLFRSATVLGPTQGKDPPSGGALAFGDAPSLRPGVGCGDKDKVSLLGTPPRAHPEPQKHFELCPKNCPIPKGSPSHP